MKKTHDFIILGAGTAGLSAREEVAKKTNNYLVIDPGPFGTTCARAGCMPSKVFIEAANIFHQTTKFAKIGASGARVVKIDSRKFMQHVQTLRDYFVNGNIKSIAKWKKKHLIQAPGRFISKKEIEVGKNILSAKRFIVATGSTPIIPKEWSVPQSKLLTTDTFFELEKLPKRMAVIGSGPIGLELGQALARLQVDVTIFGEAKTVGGLSDRKVAKMVVRILSRELTFLDEVVEDVEQSGSKLKVITKTKSHYFDQVLVAIGRRPNLESLDLDRLGIKLDHSGVPILDKKFAIPGTHIQMVGDVNEHRPLLHEAGYQGFSVGRGQSPKDQVALAITFTSPNIALVGASYRSLRKQKKSFVTGTEEFNDQGRARAKLENEGTLQLYVERVSGKILGAEIFCPEGEHLAHLLAWSITSKLTVYDLKNYPFYHPTLEEGLSTAIDDAISKMR